MQRRAVVTVRRPRARMVPSTSTSAFSQVGLVKSDWNGANRSAKVCEWNTKLSFNYYVHFLSIVVEEIKLLSTRLVLKMGKVQSTTYHITGAEFEVKWHL